MICNKNVIKCHLQIENDVLSLLFILLSVQKCIVLIWMFFLANQVDLQVIIDHAKNPSSNTSWTIDLP